MAWANSKNAAALKDSVQAKYPGTQIIYTVGDLDHQGGTSDHNPDDDPRYNTDQKDSDSKQEVRAVDIMVNSAFSAAQAAALVKLLLANCRNRTYYIIYNRKMYHSKRGFAAENYSGKDPHTNHIHVSTLAAQDENSTPWNLSVITTGGGTVADSPLVQDMAYRLDALIRGQAKTSGGPSKGQDVWLVNQVNAMQKTLAALTAALGAVANDADKAEILAAVQAVGQESADRDAAIQDALAEYTDGGATAEEVMVKLGELLTAKSETPEV
jgi:hypothetical protein